ARWGGSDMGVWVRWAGAVAAAGLTVGLVTAWGGRPPDDPPKPPAAKEPPKEVAKGVEPAAKAPAPGRPRMTERVEIPWGDQIAGWSADGNWLAVAGENGVTFYDAHELTPRGGLETGKSPTVLGFLADEPVLVTYKAGAGRINREEVLQFWPPAKRLDGTIRPAPFGRTRLHDVGRPIALLDGGKAVLTVDTVYRRDPAAPPGSHPTVAGHVWRVVDAATGEVVREAARSEPLRHFVQAPSPDGKALAVLAMGPEAVRLENWDLTTGKRRWAKDLISLAGGRADTVYLSPPVFSPDGATLAVEVPRPLKPAADAGRPEGDARPEPVYDGSELRLFAAADGTERGRPAEQAAHRNTPFQFSHDGRLLRGRRAGLRDESLSIWDARGGRLVKGWDTFATAAFAPDRPVLAILEDTWYQDGNNRVKQAVLALWDVSDLVK
ncbi:MAG: hypothetical protein K2X82_22785, partial [Gemmataceae bacterium]|nr:hypothetical protein [Gemmataceae bacterium]